MPMSARIAYALGGALAVVAACELPHDRPAAPCGPDTDCPAGQVCVDQGCVAEASTCAEAVAAGDGHSCAIRDDHTAWCWGRNEAGQLGDGTVDDRTDPVQVAGATRFTMIAAGFDHTCALAEDRSVWCWGSNDSGQLGSAAASLQPVQVGNLTDIAAITVGRDHSCALTGDGHVKCWGANEYGQLGNNLGNSSRVPITVPVPGTVKELVSGIDTTCAVDDHGILVCWGPSVALGDAAMDRLPVTVAIPDAAPQVAHVAIGWDFLCALTVNGAVYCAGRNQYGQLGLDFDFEHPHTTPARVPLTVSAAAITAGAHFACATDRRDPPGLWCWGQNADGQLTDRMGLDRSTPVRSDYTDVAGASAGTVHLCTRSSAGGIACSGYNGTGQLGNGERTTELLPPPAIAGLEQVSSIALGTEHTCAVAGGAVFCWGENRAGQLGDGTLTARSRPMRAVGVPSAIAVAVGRIHSCALLADHTAMCWGDNEIGQIGDAMHAAPIALPSRVVNDDGSPLGGITQLAAGGDHTCALTDTGVWCWGSNRDSEAGVSPMTSFKRDTPVRVPLPAGVRELALGDNHSCALNANQTIMCWGASDNGERGDGTIATTEIPTLVRVPTPPTPMPLMGVEHITTFRDFTCAITAGATATCWGLGNSGEMGDGTNSGRSSPGAAVKLSGVTLLAAGSEHACAVASGGLACWGASFRGQAGPFGRGGYFASNLPAMVPLAGPAPIGLGGGGEHTCALLADHTVTCWGDGRSGQLGNGMHDRRVRVAPRLPCP